MATKSDKTQRRHVLNAEAVRLLGPILGFLRRSGISEDELLRAAKYAIDTERAADKQFDVTRIGDRHTPEKVVDHWARNAEYTNAAGKPLAISMTGAVSVTALVHGANRDASPRKVLNELIKYGNVIRKSDGKYRLINRFVNFKIPRSMPFEPNFQFLADAIASTTRGIGNRRASAQLFWIQDSVSRIPTRYVPEFLNFVKTRGTVFASEANEWLELHSTKALHTSKRKPRTSRLGIGLFPICEKE